ncbi:MAG TPA: hypothetical protein VH274_02525 [Mycobacteriales bacterium]|nr:hypothetical protein [Mycobacteriales bacterium]
MKTGLTVEEDAELRRLAALKAFGELTAVAADSFADLRARDRRDDIREPQDVVIPRPKPVSDGPVVH